MSSSFVSPKSQNQDSNFHLSEYQENATSITANFYHPEIADEIPVNEMTIAAIFPNRHSLILLLLPLIFTAIFRSVNATCQFSFEQNNKLYNYSLTAPIRNFPHGILSEDGFYKVAANGTVLWFQLCDAMIFNHDPPTCIDCWDCGGNSRCGMGCSALVANTVGGNTPELMDI
ncbi:hypothetical protein A4A49_34245 [Nicotiana attenuata]|uniref:Uncharacterized protein n=1 Tax=Nicotiana attenuata TaxID=49451 RepID=A0A1J6IV72_NICAT|nr:hypothetical protein A4A49_34245 [Nicotiana attenuata]